MLLFCTSLHHQPQHSFNVQVMTTYMTMILHHVAPLDGNNQSKAWLVSHECKQCISLAIKNSIQKCIKSESDERLLLSLIGRSSAVNTSCHTVSIQRLTDADVQAFKVAVALSRTVQTGLSRSSRQPLCNHSHSQLKIGTSTQTQDQQTSSQSWNLIELESGGFSWGIKFFLEPFLYVISGMD